MMKLKPRLRWIHEPQTIIRRDIIRQKSTISYKIGELDVIIWPIGGPVEETGGFAAPCALAAFIVGFVDGGEDALFDLFGEAVGGEVEAFDAADVANDADHDYYDEYVAC